MPSKWQNSGGHDVDAELASPVDQELAEQLYQDSQFLAERYPPSRPAEASEIDAPRHQYGWRTAGIAAAAILVACGVWQWSTGLTRQARHEAPPRHRQPAERATPTILAAPVTADPAARPPTMPAMVFHRLSGPEQEAVLDLVEDQLLSESSLSL